MPPFLKTELDKALGALTLAAGGEDVDRGLRIGYLHERYPRIIITPDGDIFTGDGSAEPDTPFVSGGGGGGSDVAYIHTQNTPDTTWTISHSLGKFPSVTTVDSGGTTVLGTVTYVDTDTVTVDFSSAFSGKAYLN